MSSPASYKAIIVLCLLVLAAAAVYALRGEEKISYRVSENVAPAVAVVPVLPSLDTYNKAAMERRIPAAGRPKAALNSMNKSVLPVVSVNTYADDYAALQDKDRADIIEISGGRMNLEAVAAQIKDPAALEKTADAWLLKIPLVIHPEAALVLRGGERLRMSSQTGAFISNFGGLFVLDSEVIGWNDAAAQPAAFAGKEKFRPYIVSWSGSETYLAGSRFAHLGFADAKAYGVTFSTSAFLLRDRPQTPRPTGWIVDCVFDDLYYGFYSYEADHVAIVGNEYKDNIVYGIDPHDRSRHLIIANNKTYGTKKKHGIIISREVNDSWIFGNHSYDNAGSGIMIDRASVRNVIAGNTMERNSGDGLVFIESSDNSSWGNTIRGNGKNGVRVRNSSNIVMRGDNISGNGLYGVDAYAVSLKNTGRDLAVDPYTPRVTLDAADISLSANIGGQFRARNIEDMTLARIQAFRAGELFSGDIEAYEGALLSALNPQGPGVRISAPQAGEPAMLALPRAPGEAEIEPAAGVPADSADAEETDFEDEE